MRIQNTFSFNPVQLKLCDSPVVDIYGNGKVAAIGYCFGGSVVLNFAKLGADLKEVVSFHGGLAGVPANKNSLKAKILVCHGESDKFESGNDVDMFKHQLVNSLTCPLNTIRRLTKIPGMI